MGGPVSARDFISGRAWGGTTALEWKSLGILELTALSTIGTETWVPWVREADVLLVAGGEATYLCHWMRAADIGGPAYALGDQSAIKVTGGTVEVVSEGHWKLLSS